MLSRAAMLLECFTLYIQVAKNYFTTGICLNSIHFKRVTSGEKLNVV